MFETNQKLASGVSIIVPCYNEEGAVAETVESITTVLDQVDKSESSFEAEMIFVNDGSHDRTLEILR